MIRLSNRFALIASLRPRVMAQRVKRVVHPVCQSMYGNCPTGCSVGYSTCVVAASTRRWACRRAAAARWLLTWSSP